MKQRRNNSVDRGRAGTRLTIHLTPGSEEDPEGTLHALFGGALDDELRKQAALLREHEPRVLEWLSASPSHLRDFVRDPVRTLGREFPDLELAAEESPRLTADDIEIHSESGSQPEVMELFQRVWEHVAANEANTNDCGAASNPVQVANVGPCLC